jgi:hypothetical protein
MWWPLIEQPVGGVRRRRLPGSTGLVFSQSVNFRLRKSLTEETRKGYYLPDTQRFINNSSQVVKLDNALFTNFFIRCKCTAYFGLEFIESAGVAAEVVSHAAESGSDRFCSADEERADGFEEFTLGDALGCVERF